MWTLLNEPISISDMREPDIGFPKRAGLDFCKPNMCLFLKKLLKNITHIWKEYLVWMWEDARNRPILVPSWAMWDNHMRDPIATFNHLNLKAMRNERLRVYGNVGHRQRLRRGGDQSPV